MEKILLDTDVILDFFFDREPFSKDASIILSQCELGKIMGYVTPVIVSNVYYLLRKTARHEKVIQNLKDLLSFIDVSTINKEIVLEAANSDFKDFEDALQNFAAQYENEMKIIVTRNIKDYKSSRLAVMTPETYLKTFKL